MLHSKSINNSAELEHSCCLVRFYYHTDKHSMKTLNCKSCSFCPNPTKYEVKLYRKLKDFGIDSELQFHEGHEHVVLEISGADLLIRVEDDQDLFRFAKLEPDQKIEMSAGSESVQILRIHATEIKEDVDQVVNRITDIAKPLER